MKGWVLDEFRRMVEDQHGIEMYDRLVTRCRLSTDGAYTVVGNYDHRDLIQLASAFATLTETTPSEVYESFGAFLLAGCFSRCTDSTRRFSSTRDLLKNIESVIHVEVRKLYPNADTPTFYYEELSETNWAVTYDSQFPFADVAAGFIRAAVNFYDEPWNVERLDLDPGTAAKFSFTVQEGIPQANV